jgi:uncharacterized protein YcaQ
MFVPKAKRVYGYYVLPILRGTAIIGRIEPVFDRRTGVLRIAAVWAEPRAPAAAGAEIRGTIDELAAWLGAESVDIGGNLPRIWARALRA